VHSVPVACRSDPKVQNCGYINEYPNLNKKAELQGAAISVAAPGNPANLGGDETASGLEGGPSSVDFPSLDHSRFGNFNWHNIMK